METEKHAKEMCATQILVKTVVLVYQRILLMTASVCWDGLDLIVKLDSTAFPILVRMEELVSQKRADIDAPAFIIMRVTTANWQIHVPLTHVRIRARARK